MQPLSRRSLIGKGSVAVGIVGATATGLTTAAGSSGVGGAIAGPEPELEPDEFDATEPVIVDITDAERGEVEVLVGERSVTFVDKSFVARVVRASR